MQATADEVPEAAPIARVVIIPAAGDLGMLDYSVPASMSALAIPGMRIVVPLGARRVVGIIVERIAQSPHPRLKPIVAVLDTERLIDPGVLDLARWMADYYLGTFADALTTALPGSVRLEIHRFAETVRPLPPPGDLRPADQSLLRWLDNRGPEPLDFVVRHGPHATLGRLKRLEKGGWVRLSERLEGAGGPTRRERWYRACRELTIEQQQEWQRKRPAQFAVYAYLRHHPMRHARAMELKSTFGEASQKLRALMKAGLVECHEKEIYREVLPGTVGEDRLVELSSAQTEAVDTICAAIPRGFQPFLLWGVTGSGKTEVYLRSIARCIADQRRALVLVPEISLTHQLVDRIRARFGDAVAVLHSNLTDGERWDEWRKIARAEVPIVVGARSAIFAPVPRLGLIIVDEEHDAAYKQDDGIRYNGRDVAVMRGKLAGCPVILGSATPSMESYHNARAGRYSLLRLPARVAARPLPSVDLIDLRRGSALGKTLLVSAQLHAALKANLAARGQSLVFLNRRGFSNFLQCHQCGEVSTCPNCSVSLTLHRRISALRCHHCEYTVPIPAACPKCGGLSLGAWGAGTEQVEAALSKLLPEARVGRMDRDTTNRKGAMRQIIQAWEQKKYDILVGTQMITKGHDVPGVTLVGVLLADLSLNLPDFRAAERTFQLLTQVAGRAGRGTHPGRVIIQTLQPSHFSLQTAAHHDFQAFAEQELAARRELGYPPFARLALVRCEGVSSSATEDLARQFATRVRELNLTTVRVLGPTPSPIERLRNRFRWQLLLRGDGSAVRHTARQILDALRQRARASDLRLIVDIDPLNML